MRYVKARIEEYQRELTYRIYVTDSLRLMPQDKYLPKRYVELLPELNTPEDKRTAEEIALDVISAAGLRLVDE